jgi:hypothetical protein
LAEAIFRQLSPTSPAFDYLGTVKDHRRAADGGAALGSFDPSVLQARSDALFDEFSLELSNCGQDVHQERGGGARLVRVQSLRNSNEPNAERLQLLDASNAVNQTPAPTVQLVHNHGIKLAQAGICHQALEAGSRGFSPGNRVLIRADKFPPTALDVLSQFANLEGVVLVCG